MDVDTLMEKGHKYSNEGNDLKAVECFEKVLEKEPGNGTAWYALGVHLYEIDLNRAMECFDLLLINGINESNVWLGKGRTYIGLGERQKAIDIFTKLTNIDPNFVEAYCDLGNIYEYDDSKKATAYYRKALDIDDKNLEALNYFTRNAFSDDNLTLALEYSDRALDVDANEYTMLTLRGDIYNGMEEYSQAKECFLKIIKNNEDDEVVWADLGTTHACLNEFEEAKKCFTKSLKLDPKQATVLLDMAHLAIMNDDWNEVLKYCKLAREQDCKDSDVYVCMGFALNGLKRYKEALYTFDEILAKVRDPDILFLKATTLLNLYEFDKALDCVNEILTLDPHHKNALDQKDNILSYLGN